MIITNDMTPDVTYSVEEDGIYREVPINELFSRKDLVIPKEIFIEAYNKWIEVKGDKK